MKLAMTKATKHVGQGGACPIFMAAVPLSCPNGTVFCITAVPISGISQNAAFHMQYDSATSQQDAYDTIPVLACRH